MLLTILSYFCMATMKNKDHSPRKYNKKAQLSLTNPHNVFAVYLIRLYTLYNPQLVARAKSR